jgi:hypothetical protein
MKITIISYDNWGLNKTLVDGLKCLGHEVVHIDFNEFKYQYPNFLYRIKIFFLSFFLKKILSIFITEKK